MGEEIVSFKCHHCNHCCTDVICLLTPWDVRRIMRVTGKNPFDFIDFLTTEEIRDVAVDDPTWLEVDGERYIMALQRDKESGCTFLDNETRLCSIYEARPILCRLYPFDVKESREGTYESVTLDDDVDCPKHDDGRVPVKPLYDLYVQEDLNQEDYYELVEAFNSKQYEGKEVADFVIMFTGGLAHFEENVVEANTEA